MYGDLNNYVILKWGALKAYNFTEEFYEKHSDVIDELSDVWDRQCNNSCGAMDNGKNVRNNGELKHDLINVLSKIYDLGVPFQNGFTDEYYNSFEEIRSYILNNK